MHRFYLESEQSAGHSIALSGNEAHHALHVLRIREGDRITVLDGAGHELQCQVAGHSRKEISLTVLARQTVPPLPCAITLAQALTKAKSMDLIIQKATELGAFRIAPVAAERSVAQVEERDAPAKVEKWRTIAIEAMKQCGTPWLPRIEAPRSVGAILAAGESGQFSLIASLQPEAQHPRVCLEDWVAKHGRLPESVCIWVGPEGDFTPAELELIQRHGALPISLGRQVLRSETAAIFCLSVLQYELQAPR